MVTDNILTGPMMDVEDNPCSKTTHNWKQNRCIEPSPWLEDRGIRETLDVPDDKVSVLVGRGGRMIIHIQDASGTKLNLHSTRDKDRSVEIRGSHEGVEIARRMILKILKS